MALGEYFTETEFRDLAQDEDAPQKYETEDIERAHDEVVDRLELWARSSWGPPRTAKLKKVQMRAFLDLSRVPIIDFTTFTVGGTAMVPAEYDVDNSGGQVMWGDWADGIPSEMELGPYVVEVEWTYGFDLDVAEIPWGVKRPVIKAANSLLVPDKRKAKIPANTRSFSTQRANFDLRFERAQTKPWPWDEGASSQVRAYWDPFRWRAYMS
jgi:hypothetical protein